MLLEIKQSPSFLYIWIANKDTLTTSWSKIVFIVNVIMSITHTYEYSEMSLISSLLYSFSDGVFPSKTWLGVRLIKYDTVSIHSPQNSMGRLAWNREALATLKICLCFLYALNFNRVVAIHEVSWMVPFSINNQLNPKTMCHSRFLQF